MVFVFEVCIVLGGRELEGYRLGNYCSVVGGGYRGGIVNFIWELKRRGGLS